MLRELREPHQFTLFCYYRLSPCSPARLPLLPCPLVCPVQTPEIQRRRRHSVYHAVPAAARRRPGEHCTSSPDRVVFIWFHLTPSRGCRSPRRRSLSICRGLLAATARVAVAAPTCGVEGRLACAVLFTGCNPADLHADPAHLRRLLPIGLSPPLLPCLCPFCA